MIFLILIIIISFFSFFFSLPGNFILLFTALVYSLATGFKIITFREILLLLFLSIFAEIFESFTFYLGAKKSSHFKTSLLFSVIGGIVFASLGGLVLPLLGIIPGALLGSYIGGVGAEIIHKESWKTARAIGMKVLLLHLLALAVKLTIFISMAVWFFLKIL